MDHRLSSFVPGESHAFEVEVDLWPDITYSDGGYRGLSVEVAQTAEDQQKMNAVKENIREKFIILEDTAANYQAKLGDVLMVNMRGFEKDASGNKGAALPSIASGDQVEIVLEKGKFMEGMVESLINGKTGEKKEITVKFPVRAKGPGAAVSGKEAIFEIEIMSIKTRALPAWDEALAARVRPGLDLKGLEEEVKFCSDCCESFHHLLACPVGHFASFIIRVLCSYCDAILLTLLIFLNIGQESSGRRCCKPSRNQPQ